MSYTRLAENNSEHMHLKWIFCFILSLTVITFFGAPLCSQVSPHGLNNVGIILSLHSMCNAATRPWPPLPLLGPSSSCSSWSFIHHHCHLHKYYIESQCALYKPEAQCSVRVQLVEFGFKGNYSRYNEQHITISSVTHYFTSKVKLVNYRIWRCHLVLVM